MVATSCGETATVRSLTPQTETPMALQDLVRLLLPRDDHFFVFLEKQASVADAAASELTAFGKGTEASAVIGRLEKVELEGDEVVAKLERALQETFVTPIDREDIQRLSAELDDVTDFIDEAGREAALYGVQKATPAMGDLIGKLGEATKALSSKIGALRAHDYAALMELSRTLRRIRKEGDAIHRKASTDLFHDESKSAKDIIREKAVLDNIERAVERCEWVAHTLANLAVKHG
jgi:uncharacterized protein Yka (UPF0111/DUF47 family)